ncbi:hypothetical protein GCM10028806_06240 [Spirosoma terrae]|uniref:Uncharacterized protein n=1 Tax=Spirosoma terrae TaxID=1968276 RepID=A0A6L9LFX5_9BACT|nr:hypothetical protein [Spirosoma terrae]NDU98547.1 hypothetical protein [Spirosoma terrae]
MSKRKRIKFLLVLAVLSGLGYGLYQYYQPPLERQQIRFVDSAQAMEDSIRTLRQICQNIETIKAPQFMNCVVQPWDSIMYFRGESVGRFDTLTFANPAFKDMKKGEVRRLLLLLSFLNRNFVSGVYHDTSIDFWLYTYRPDPYYSSFTQVRSLYLCDNRADTLKPAFKHYFTILDRKKKMLLLARNNVQYQRF